MSEQNEIYKLAYRFCREFGPCECEDSNDTPCQDDLAHAQLAYRFGARLPDPVDDLAEELRQGYLLVCDSPDRPSWWRFAAQVAIARGAK